MAKVNVSAVRVVKRSQGPDSLTVQETEIRERSELEKVVALLVTGERVDYYVRPRYASTYIVQLLDPEGNVLEASRVVGDGIIVNDRGSFVPKRENLSSVLDKLLSSRLARKKHQKVADMLKRFSLAPANKAH